MKVLMPQLLKTLIVAVLVLMVAPSTALAHCDTMDGPVVKAAQQAVRTRNINFVLIWIQQKDEVEVRQAFQQTIIVRRLSREARQLADQFFFETVVRLHRAGEGQSYTGLKPAGTDLGAVIPAADRAIDNNAIEPLLKLFPDINRQEIISRFNEVITSKNFRTNDVVAGRQYVGAYTSFLEYIEQLYERISAKHHHWESKLSFTRSSAST
jgi:Family of unknown function (DUF6448)